MPLTLLPDELCKSLRDLIVTLRKVESTLSIPELLAAEASAEVAQAKRSLPPEIAQIQRQFQEILAVIAAIDLPPAVEQRLRPLQTEAHRRLRLLGIESMRLKTAKQQMTLDKVRSQLQAHIEQLQGFAQAIADEACG